MTKSRPTAARKRREKIQRRAALLETRLRVLCFRVALDEHAGELEVFNPATRKRVAVVDLNSYSVDVLDDTYRGGVVAAVSNAKKWEARKA